MKRMVSLFFALTLMSGLALAQGDAAKAPSTAKLTNDTEKMSYVIGSQIGGTIKDSGLEISQDALAAGLSDVLNDRAPALTDEETQKVNEQLRDIMMKKREEMMKKKSEEDAKAGEANLKAAEEFLAENGKKDGVITTESGLQYQILQPGEGPSPKEGDMVEVNYTGTFLDGKEFDSTVKRGKTAEFPVGGLIEGWNEALTLMKKGEKVKLFIHPKLAYKEAGRPGAIPPNSMLIFEMELVNFKPAEKDPASANQVVIPTPAQK